MAGLTAGDIASARADMAGLLSDTCEHFKKTKEVAASGSSKSTWVSQGEYPCLVYVASGGKTMASETKMIGEGNADVAEHIIRLPWDANVKPSDKLVIAGDDGDTFLVTSTGDNDTSRFLLQVGAQRIASNK